MHLYADGQRAYTRSSTQTCHILKMKGLQCKKIIIVYALTSCMSRSVSSLEKRSVFALANSAFLDHAPNTQTLFVVKLAKVYSDTP